MPRILFDEDSDLESDFETELGTLKEKPKKTERGSDDELEESDDAASDGGDLIQDSDDDAPEAVSFTSGRQSALTAMKSAMEQIQKDKISTKDKRRKQDEQYKKQKEEKLALLAKRKLPEDLLASVSASRQKIDLEGKKKKMKKERKQVEVVEEPEFQSDLDSEQEGFRSAEDDNFIPLGRSVSGFQVVSVKEVSKAKSLSQDAKNFRQNKLFGSRVPRESVQAKMAKETKRKVQAMRTRPRR
ncbi:U3 small nucleolar RNA-associated protein NOL7-like [Lineus longissimus]|uniref:U3 small nucleolar RNA-associated protein NOL7-like n=1 Tax=Lineus longissimus TaxID=88925 RepID=UPI002B4F2CF1